MLGSKRTSRLSRILGPILLSLMLAPVLGSAPVPPPPGADPQERLHALKISGNKTLKTQQIKEDLATLKPRRWFWKKRPVFRPEELDDAVERLKALYRRNGFYHTQVTFKVKESPSGLVDISINIEEGPSIKVTGVEIQVEQSPVSPALAPLKAQHPLKPGDRFTEEAYESLKRVYLSYLGDNGYPRAKVTGQISLDDRLNTAQIRIKVVPGVLCYFGEVRIKGQVEAPERLIRRQILFKPGQKFSFKKIYDSQQKIYGLDLFKSVALTPEEVPEKITRIPILVAVQERKKKSLKLGLGYGDEDEFRVRMLMRYRNLFGGGRMFDVDAKYSRLEYRLTAGIINPQVFTTSYDLVLQTGVVRRYLPGFTDKAFFTQERLEKDLFWKFRLYFGHGLEFSRPFNIPTETLILLTTTEAGKTYRASMFIWGFKQDTTDNPVDPRRGGRISLTGEVAPDFFGSDLQFASSVLDVRRYLRLGKSDFVLATRVKYGVIQPIEGTTEIPIFRRFFSGGIDSVRGYGLDLLGPRNRSGNPVGGESVLEGSVEARIPLYQQFRGVIFLDAGNVFLKIKDTDPGQLKYAAGVGLRYQTFFGPLGVDFGFPLNRIDPRRDDPFRVHFTIGQAF